MTKETVYSKETVYYDFKLDIEATPATLIVGSFDRIKYETSYVVFKSKCSNLRFKVESSLAAGFKRAYTNLKDCNIALTEEGYTSGLGRSHTFTNGITFNLSLETFEEIKDYLKCLSWEATTTEVDDDLVLISDPSVLTGASLGIPSLCWQLYFVDRTYASVSPHLELVSCAGRVHEEESVWLKSKATGIVFIVPVSLEKQFRHFYNVDNDDTMFLREAFVEKNYVYPYWKIEDGVVFDNISIAFGRACSESYKETLQMLTHCGADDLVEGVPISCKGKNEEKLHGFSSITSEDSPYKVGRPVKFYSKNYTIRGVITDEFLGDMIKITNGIHTYFVRPHEVTFDI